MSPAKSPRVEVTDTPTLTSTVVFRRVLVAKDTVSTTTTRRLAVRPQREAHPANAVRAIAFRAPQP